MNQSRRKFIKLSGAMGTGIAFSSLTGLALNSCGGQKIDKFGLGLYTLRDDLPKDPKAVLTEVAAAGYKQIESYEGPLGIFWGMGHTGFKKLMDDLGMTIVASHADINKDFETKAAQAAEIGMKYLLSPWLGPQKTLDDYKKAAETFNQKAEICKKNGIRFGYHNHDYTFIPLEGQMPQDILMSNTDPSLVDFELDIYWIVTAGQDPEAWFRKYKNRFRLVHVKDRIKNSTEKEATCDLGTGQIDYPRILKTAKENGVNYFLVEQERYDGSTPLKSVAANAVYMKNLKI